MRDPNLNAILTIQQYLQCYNYLHAWVNQRNFLPKFAVCSYSTENSFDPHTYTYNKDKLLK